MKKNKPLPDETKDYLREIGKRGGDVTKQRGADYYQEIGRKGAARRWTKKNEEA